MADLLARKTMTYPEFFLEVPIICERVCEKGRNCVERYLQYEAITRRNLHHPGRTLHSDHIHLLALVGSLSRSFHLPPVDTMEIANVEFSGIPVASSPEAPLERRVMNQASQESQQEKLLGRQP